LALVAVVFLVALLARGVAGSATRSDTIRAAGRAGVPLPRQIIWTHTAEPDLIGGPAPVTANGVLVVGTLDGQVLGIQSGSGGGRSGTGSGGAGNGTYGRYLGYVLQQAVARDEQVRRLSFQLTVNIWLDPTGAVTRVELLRGSGNPEADERVLQAIRAVGRIDERPPASLDFPARVLVQGRRPAG
jgi:TonB family protein